VSDLDVLFYFLDYRATDARGLIFACKKTEYRGEGAALAEVVQALVKHYLPRIRAARATVKLLKKLWKKQTPMTPPDLVCSLATVSVLLHKSLLRLLEGCCLMSGCQSCLVFWEPCLLVDTLHGAV
jgi:hypothetical protein